MRILLANHELSWIGGTETYTVTVAEHLQRLGHQVSLFAPVAGEMADVARDRGLVVITDERSLQEEPDVVYAQDAYAALLLAERFPSTPQAMAIHADEYDLWLPPQLPGVTAAVVALHERVANRARAAAVVPEVVRLRQPVDTERFSPRGRLHDPPRRALLLGNYLMGDRLEVVAQACEDAGIEWAQVGAGNGGQTREPESLMGDADIVIGKARVIVEAMASGRAAYVYDHNGGDGWVTSERYALLEADNFGGQAEPVAADLERLRTELKAYRPDMGVANRQLAVRNHSANKHAQELVLLFRRLNPSPRPVDAPLRELARLVRVQTGIDRRAHGLAAEAQQAREREHAVSAELEEQIRALWARVNELGAAARDALEREQSLRRQRRVRFGLALARPLDFVRRLFR